MNNKRTVIVAVFVLLAFTLISGVADASAVRARRQNFDPSQNIVIEPGAMREVVVNAVTRQQIPAQRKALQTAFVIIVGYLFMIILIKFGNRKLTNIKVRHIFRRNVVYVVHGLIFVLTFFIWMQSLSSITIFLGVASAGLALALQEVILCVAGWALIMVRHPFEVGDRIEIKGIKGDIIDIRLFQTSLLEIGNWVDADQSTGRIVNVPNSFVFKAENFNYSRGFEFIWNEIPILVTFESDWKKAKEIMMRHVDKLAEGMEMTVRRKIDAMKNRYMIYYETVTPIVYVNIKDSGVELTIRYLTEAKMRRSTQDKLCQSLLEDFAKEPTINFAYPTYRIVKE